HRSGPRGRWAVGHLEGVISRREGGDSRPISIAKRGTGRSGRGGFSGRASQNGAECACRGALIMAGGISAPFIRLPIATSLLMIGILCAGIVAYPRLPVAPLPQVDFPTIQVSALLPGAGPETMASSVAQPLET